MCICPLRRDQSLPSCGYTGTSTPRERSVRFMARAPSLVAG
eukprot:CAMPEP_0203826874 /NCGR_PEP_ID=MMETSP0115-20131106/57595_1 /ASSEMBLY_ACC=CAM_ASM_000227 /TAXON_ID=33651 /ORGANISM="Bicosoecid sp, Strain ms1" /LENGTH=40 /DNA_ID= /DNA_START= /DNA_END= /DNA_ORIENTATION=